MDLKFLTIFVIFRFSYCLVDIYLSKRIGIHAEYEIDMNYDFSTPNSVFSGPQSLVFSRIELAGCK